jgi:phosphoribosylglycinamide formyltransferase-1
MTRPLPIGVLVSGEGTTLDALAESALGGHLPARVAIVLADRPHVPAIEKARRRGIPTEVVPFRGMPEAEWVARMDALLRQQGVELVVLAGFLAILPARFVELWNGRIINLHPSLLPRYGGRGFYGHHVFEAILAHGDAETGVSVHLVTAEVDRGAVLEQRRMPVPPGATPESMRTMVHPHEVAALESVIRRFAEGELPLPYPTPLGSRSSEAGPEPPREPPKV